MAGGLIQLVLSGKEDSYLTVNPHITFFKRIYRRHTIFGIELIQHIPEQQAEYNNRISFKLNNIGDLIGKCYIEIELPSLSFTENKQITLLKENELSNIKKSINKYKLLYENLSKFCSIEILLYQILNNLIKSVNINLNIIKQTVIRFNSKYKKQKDELVNLIFDDVYGQINLSNYILQLSKSIVSDDYINYNENINIYISELKQNILSYYQNMKKNLKYYHSNWKYYENNYNNLNNTNINVAWADNLAHYFFTDFEVEIGGQVVESYSAEQAYIYQYHYLREESKKNYNEMLGNNSNLNLFNNIKKEKKTIILPLNFWFCKNIGCALPTVALANSHVAINLKINKLKNLLYFQDYEKEYYDMLNITMPYDTAIRNELSIFKYSYDSNSKLATYKCNYINKKLFSLKYPTLSDTIIDEIFDIYGQNNMITLREWIKYKKNYKSNINILNRDLLNNYNEYYSLIDKPSIKLITESIYLDDIERTKFCSSKLEYVIEIFQENIFDLENTLLFNAELSIDRPIKELLWVTQPKLFLNGLSEYGKVYNTFDFNRFFKNEYYSSFNISLNQLNINKTSDLIFFNQYQSYKYYNNSLPENVYAYNFGLYPEEIQPSGTANFSMLKGKLINFNLNQSFINEYFNTDLNPNLVGLIIKFFARSYNFFVVEKGYGQMIFSSS